MVDLSSLIQVCRYGNTNKCRTDDHPGGPAGSGVLQVLERGKRIQDIVSSSKDALKDARTDTRFYDIISFDPRGTGYSTPRLECIPTTFAQSPWNMEMEVDSVIGSSLHAFDHAWARSQALALSCAYTSNATSIAHQMSTVEVAQDLVQILDNLGKWRTLQHGYISTDLSQSPMMDPGLEKLQYWGFSYGTVLGATFATMYPARVKRMVLDGVADAEDYYHSGGFSLESLQDSDAIMDKFFEYCFNSVQGKCIFHEEESRDDLVKKLDRILEDVSNDPIPVARTDHRGPDIITYSDVMRLIQAALYEPLQQFEAMSVLLADLVQRNGSRFADLKENSRRSSECLLAQNASQSCISKDDFRPDARSAIVCGDVLKHQARTKGNFAKTQLDYLATSRWLGPLWIAYEAICANWQITPEVRFNCECNALKPVRLLICRSNNWSSDSEPSSPRIHVGSCNSNGKVCDIVAAVFKADPISALKMSRKFPGSVVLLQDSEGVSFAGRYTEVTDSLQISQHCSYSSDSDCTDRFIRRYFQLGLLPEPGFVCQPNRRPFQEVR
jgi:pimeloyl-ACP methyl ester carboxylesterase